MSFKLAVYTQGKEPFDMQKRNQVQEIIIRP